MEAALPGCQDHQLKNNFNYTITNNPAFMTFEEVTPHLNKISRIKLKNNKRKVGWLFYDCYHQLSSEPIKEVHCVNMHIGRKLNELVDTLDALALKPHSTSMQIEDILDIRSCK